MFFWSKANKPIKNNNPPRCNDESKRFIHCMKRSWQCDKSKKDKSVECETMMKEYISCMKTPIY